MFSVLYVIEILFYRLIQCGTETKNSKEEYKHVLVFFFFFQKIFLCFSNENLKSVGCICVLAPTFSNSSINIHISCTDLDPGRKAVEAENTQLALISYLAGISVVKDGSVGSSSCLSITNAIFQLQCFH